MPVFCRIAALNKAYREFDLNDFKRSIVPSSGLGKILSIADVIFSPIVYLSAIVLYCLRRLGISRFNLCKKALLRVGVFPIRNHYYEPLFDTRQLRKPLSENRNLTGINWNTSEQLEMLNNFNFSAELKDLPLSKTGERSFYLNNGLFESGDAEYWYYLIRYMKPNTIIEVGSGYSTLMAIEATKKNREELPYYECEHICIEPYERPWLEKLGVAVIRKKVEDVDVSMFNKLSENDILFIDSSHMIRPQGDVLFEYLELLPTLNRGVIVHVHDIFSPRDYPEYMIKNRVLFWNEQYLLEAFITSNDDWKIVGALNYLHHNHYEILKEKCIHLTPNREPGSFYMKKIISR